MPGSPLRRNQRRCLVAGLSVGQVVAAIKAEMAALDVEGKFVRIEIEAAPEPGTSTPLPKRRTPCCHRYAGEGYDAAFKEIVADMALTVLGRLAKPRGRDEVRESERSMGACA
jgi:hypothetical protein